MDVGYDFDGRDERVDEILPPRFIGTERRMQVRALEHWTSLLSGRRYPSVADLGAHEFLAHSAVLDFRGRLADPRIVLLGERLREECGVAHDLASVADVPARSLLSRLTDDCRRILTVQAPIGFQAEFINHQRLPTLYRGILMPLSSDGEVVDHVHGVINWKHEASPALAKALARDMRRQMNGPAVAARLNPWSRRLTLPELD